MEIILLVAMVALVMLAIIAIIVYSLNYSKIKGEIGEARVARQLNKLNDEKYKIFHDVLIKTDRGSSQIDHIIVSIYGIFVIETKNFSGWIFGNENSEYWTQVIYRHKTKFRNPIKQNWSHVLALKNIFYELESIIYHSIVVFSGSGELKKIDSKTPVIYDNEISKYIISKNEPILSHEEFIFIVNKLNEINIKDKSSEKEHIQQVKKHIHKRIQNINQLICPKCNSILILKKGQHGKFHGCSNYPRCRYTHN